MSDKTKETGTRVNRMHTSGTNKTFGGACASLRSLRASEKKAILPLPLPLCAASKQALHIAVPRLIKRIDWNPHKSWRWVSEWEREREIVYKKTALSNRRKKNSNAISAIDSKWKNRSAAFRQSQAHWHRLVYFLVQAIRSLQFHKLTPTKTRN